MRIVSLACLALVAAPAVAEPSLSLHVVPASYSGCSAVDLVDQNCGNMIAEGNASQTQFAFVVAGGHSELDGLRFGVDYPPSVNVIHWARCGTGAENPEAGWPASGRGNEIAYYSAQVGEGGDGLVKVGYFVIAPGSNGAMSLAADPRSGTAEFEVDGTDYLYYDDQLGVADVDGGGTGRVACVPRAAAPEFVSVIFRSGIVTMPLGQAIAPASGGSISSLGIVSLLQANGVTEIEREWPGFDPASDLSATTRTGESVDLIDFSETYRLKLPAGSTTSDWTQFAAALDAAAETHLAEVIFGSVLTSSTCPTSADDDPDFVDQWHLRNDGGTFSCAGANTSSGTAGVDINAETAWDITTGSGDVKMVIMDETFPPDVNDEFGDRILSWESNRPFDRAHGVKVAATAAGAGCNGYLGRGLDWNVKIHSREFSQHTAQTLRDMVFVDDALVSNHSYIGGYGSVRRAAYRDLYLANHVAVAATGNDHCESGNWTHDETYPSSFDGPGVLSVGGVGIDDNLNWATGGVLGCHGTTLDLVGPADNIVIATTDPNTLTEGMACNSGTSISSPMVAGVASLMFAKSPSLYNDDVENLIKRAADNIIVAGEQADGEDIITGQGRLNAGRALEYLQDPWLIERGEVVGGTVLPLGSIPYEANVFGSPFLEDGETAWLIRKVVHSDYVEWNDTYTNHRAWGRGVASTGVSIDDTPQFLPRAYNYSINWCDALTPEGPGTKFFSYIYEIYADQQATQFLGTIPNTDPATGGTPVADWIFAYTMHAMGDAPPPIGRTRPELELSASSSGTGAVVSFELDGARDVDVRVHDAMGRFVARLANGHLGVGGHRVRWEGQNESGQPVGAGIYFVVLESRGSRASAKVALVR